ncbi:MAG: FkbM family methyltransferase [Acinetobacter sp.]|nr:FkbM family methyltransferase [Acinetobacter sp.]DAB11911.1 MAG TPA: hypothetical protein CPT91_05060 [Candidatus Gastranaerophilales bacterium HUM_16]
MLKDKLFEDLYDRVPEEGNVVIFGACKAGEGILKDLAIYKPKIMVLGFIDNMVKKDFNNLPVWSLKEFIDQSLDCHLVIMATQTDKNKIMNLFDIYDIPAIEQSAFVSDYYRNNLKILSDENYKNVIDIFEKADDRELFDNIFKIRKNILEPEFLEKYHYETRENRCHTYHVYRKQYLEKINKGAVKILFDLGLNDGFNVIAFNKLLPNLKKTYGFEAIYDIVRKPYVEDFILNNKLDIIPLALGDSIKKIKFCINKTHLGGSFAEEITGKKCPENSPNWESRIVDVTTMDKFCEERNVLPDFIKMDIEGAELAALKGGIKTITKCRPQLAISIYHSSEDFINIPLYLKDNLKNYAFRLGHYSPKLSETVLYAIPNELL